MNIKSKEVILNRILKALVSIVVGSIAFIGATGICEETGPQKFVLTTDGVEITKELQSKTVVVLNNVELCAPSAQHLSSAYSFSNYCPRGVCQSTLEFNGLIPKSLTLYRQYQGKCVQQTVSNLEPYQALMYFTKVSIDSDLVQKLNISKPKASNIKRTQNSSFISNEFIRLGDKATITLKYGKDPVSLDEFLYESKLIRIKYANGPKVLPAIARALPLEQKIAPNADRAVTKPPVNLHLTVNGGLEKVLKFGSSNKFSIAGGQPGQVLIPYCEGPMNPCPGVGFIFQARVNLNKEGKQELDSPFGEGSGIQPGQYKFWLATFDRSAETNKVSIVVQR